MGGPDWPAVVVRWPHHRRKRACGPWTHDDVGAPSSDLDFGATCEIDRSAARRRSVYGFRRDGGSSMAERTMPSFSKSPPELVERFAAVLAEYPQAQRKPMFGYPAAFVGGNMATSLFRDLW